MLYNLDRSSLNLVGDITAIDFIKLSDMGKSKGLLIMGTSGGDVILVNLQDSTITKIDKKEYFLPTRISYIWSNQYPAVTTITATHGAENSYARVIIGFSNGAVCILCIFIDPKTHKPYNFKGSIKLEVKSVNSQSITGITILDIHSMAVILRDKFRVVKFKPNLRECKLTNKDDSIIEVINNEQQRITCTEHIHSTAMLPITQRESIAYNIYALSTAGYLYLYQYDWNFNPIACKKIPTPQRVAKIAPPSLGSNMLIFTTTENKVYYIDSRDGAQQPLTIPAYKAPLNASSVLALNCDTLYYVNQQTSCVQFDSLELQTFAYSSITSKDLREEEPFYNNVDLVKPPGSP